MGGAVDDRAGSRVRTGSAESAAARDAGEQAWTAGPAGVPGSARDEYLSAGLTLVATAVAVNLASTAITARVSRVAARLREDRSDQPDVRVVRRRGVRS